MRLGDMVTFPDGQSFEVKVISDLHCCCLCRCPFVGGLEILVKTYDVHGEKDLANLGTGDLDRPNKLFDQYKVTKIDYLYNGESDSLPLCDGDYNPNLVELFFIVSLK